MSTLYYQVAVAVMGQNTFDREGPQPERVTYIHVYDSDKENAYTTRTAISVIQYDNGTMGVDPSETVGWPKDSWIYYDLKGNHTDPDRYAGVPRACLMEFFLILFEGPPDPTEDYKGPKHYVVAKQPTQAKL